MVASGSGLKSGWIENLLARQRAKPSCPSQAQASVAGAGEAGNGLNLVRGLSTNGCLMSNEMKSADVVRSNGKEYGMSESTIDDAALGSLQVARELVMNLGALRDRGDSESAKQVLYYIDEYYRQQKAADSESLRK
jgi:hypothetical protein